MTRPSYILAIWLLTAAPCLALDWHTEGWPYRAVVRVEAAGSAGVDVAAVRIRHCGAASVQGGFRIHDSVGRPVPYQVTHHDPVRDALISFQASDKGKTVAIYYGRTDAPADPVRAVDVTEPGAGPPQPGPGANGWIPRAGLVLTTMRRPVPEDRLTHDNPNTVAELAEMLKNSPGLDGADYRQNISDGLNPFGDSDYYIGVYKGWIRLPDAGTWGFCTASNEASFSFLDGAPLVHWPGRHTEQRGRHAQKSAEHELKAGLHHVEYYHEEVLLYQVAFLGCKAPGGKHYEGIPGDWFPKPHRAAVLRYEGAGGERMLTLRPQQLDSIMPAQRPAGQYTRYGFEAGAGDEPLQLRAWKITWSFGDGQKATGPSVQHVYLSCGTYDVVMTAIRPGRKKLTRRWPLLVHPIEHIAAPYLQGQLKTYMPVVARLEPKLMSPPHLLELARFHLESGRADEANRIAEHLAAREAAEPSILAAGHRMAAALALRESSPIAFRHRREHLESAFSLEPQPAVKARSAAELIHLVGVLQGEAQEAKEIYQRVMKLAMDVSTAGAFQAALRSATIAAGDARLYDDDVAGAEQAYAAAEELAEVVLPPQVRVARMGQWHETIHQHLAEGKLDEARAAAEDWRTTLPSEQLRGEVLFLIGKIQMLRRRPHDALPMLKMAVRRGEGNDFEAEARWLLAEAQGAAGNPLLRRAALFELRDSTLDSPFVEKAVKALAGKE